MTSYGETLNEGASFATPRFLSMWVIENGFALKTPNFSSLPAARTQDLCNEALVSTVYLGRSPVDCLIGVLNDLSLHTLKTKTHFCRKEFNQRRLLE